MEKKKMMLLVLAVVLVLTSITSVGAYLAYQKLSGENNVKESDQKTSESKSDKELVEKDDDLEIDIAESTEANSLLYVGYLEKDPKSELMSYDLNTFESTKIISSDSLYNSFRNGNLIGDTFYYISSQESISGTYDKFNSYNLKTAEETEFHYIKGEPGYRISSLEMHSENLFAYTINRDLPNGISVSWEIVLVEDGEESVVESVQESVGGRGGYYHDNDSISFNNDGTKFAQIRTYSSREFNIFVYDVATKSEVAVIESATHPVWLDNNTLLYVQIDGDEAIYSYEIESETSTKLVDGEKVSLLTLSPDAKNLMFINAGDHDMLVYNFASKEVTRTHEMVNYGLWVTDDTIAYVKVALCNEAVEECSPVSDTKIVGYEIYDIVAGEVVHGMDIRIGSSLSFPYMK